MRGAEAVLHTDLFAIYPKSGFPMATFNEQLKQFAFPGSRNIYCFLIPGGPFVIFYGLKPEGDLYISLVAVFGILRFYKPGGVPDITNPGGIDVNLVSFSIAGHRTGQFNGIGQFPAKPLLFYSLIQRVYLKTPFPG